MAIENAAFPTPGMGLTLDSNGQLHQTVQKTIPGYDFAYKEFAADVPVTAVTAATAVTVVTAAAASFDGATTVWVEFEADRADTAAAAGAVVIVDIWDAVNGAAATDLGIIGSVLSAAAASAGSTFSRKRKLTPAAGSHVFSARAWQAGGNGTIRAGAGGAGANLPGHIRVYKA